MRTRPCCTKQTDSVEFPQVVEQDSEKDPPGTVASRTSKNESWVVSAVPSCLLLNILQDSRLKHNLYISL